VHVPKGAGISAKQALDLTGRGQSPWTGLLPVTRCSGSNICNSPTWCVLIVDGRIDACIINATPWGIIQVKLEIPETVLYTVMNSSGIPDYKKQEAINLYASGNLMAAKKLCEEICRMGVSDHDVYCILGIIAGKTGQYTDAVTYCLQSISLCSEHLDAYFNLGLAFMKLGRSSDAARALEFVIDRRSNDYNAWYALGLVKTICGDHPRAIECFQAARRINPRFLDAVAGEAQIFEKQGEIERAFDLIQPYINKFPAHPKLSLVYGKLLLRKGDFTLAVDDLEKLACDDSISLDDKSSLHFLLGELLDRSGSYDAAFRHYREGNRLKGVHFDTRKFRQQIDGMINQFDILNADHIPNSHSRSDLPVFIVGSPRSGTSLVEQILASHKDVYGAGELTNISRFAEEFVWLARRGERITTAFLDERAEQYLCELRKLSPVATRITDKMPGNYFNLGYIEKLFPNSRVIHVSRNPLDTCLSCYFQDFTAAHAYAYDLEDLGIYYKGYRQLMNHWNGVLRLRTLDVVYEELVKEPEREIRRLLDFCGLEWDENCLRYHESKRMIRTASYYQANRPIYRNSVNRWRHYEKHIEPLIRMLSLDEV